MFNCIGRCQSIFQTGCTILHWREEDSLREPKGLASSAPRMNLGSLWGGSVALSSLSKWALPEKLHRDQGGNLGVFPGHGTKWNIHWLNGLGKAWRVWGGWILPLTPLSLRSPLEILGWAQLQWALMLTSLVTQTGREPSVALAHVDVALWKALRSGPFWEASEPRSIYHPAHPESPLLWMNLSHCKKHIRIAT